MRDSCLNSIDWISLGEDAKTSGVFCQDPPELGFSSNSSTNEFHWAQDGHLPIHLGDWCPQFWQNQTVFVLDKGRKWIIDEGILVEVHLIFD
jgi:hypothetical protein